MLYPLSYEGLRCPFALDTGESPSVGLGAGYLAPDGLCRTCAVERVTSFWPPALPRGRLYG